MRYFVVVGDPDYANPVIYNEAELAALLGKIKTDNGVQWLIDNPQVVFAGQRFLAELTPIVPAKQEAETVIKATKWVLPPVEKPPQEKKWRRATIEDCGKYIFPFQSKTTFGPFSGDSTGYIAKKLMGMTNKKQFVLDSPYCGNLVVVDAWIYE